MFSGGSKIPCVGISIGVERVFALLLKRLPLNTIKVTETEVMVIGAGSGLLEDRMKICSELWNAGIKAEFLFKTKPKLAAQWAACEKDLVPFAVIIGEDEIANNVVKIKNMDKNMSDSTGNREITVPRSEMIKVLKEKLSTL